MNETGFVPIERQSVVLEAIDQIGRLISSGKLKPGEQLPAERSLSVLLGVSRPTLREAIRVLSFTGILETRLGNGTFVCTGTSATLADALGLVVAISREAEADLIAVRLVLEVGAAELAAGKITDKQLGELGDTLVRTRASVRVPSRFSETDIDFHRRVHEAAGNVILSRLLLSVSALGVHRRVVTGKISELRSVTLAEHEEIFQALRDHDPLAARDAMRRHIQNATPHLEEPQRERNSVGRRVSRRSAVTERGGG
jgi:GntR family transcriptional repressor for pyruvate dehydrogenase complex